MQVNNKIFDDLARIAGGAMGAVAGMRNEIEAQIRQQLERVLAQMDVVGRDEFEAVRAMASTARAEQEALAERVAALEATIAALVAAQPAAGGDSAGPKRRGPRPVGGSPSEHAQRDGE
ncbi:MAG: accessory factor UbiK family protein [Azospirillum sp.]|nr:accessory factor UbiK family protein [Azospirillum sp.]